MVKLNEDYLSNKDDFTNVGITTPKFDQVKIKKETEENPRWVHFGGGNLFRCFHATIAQDLLNNDELDSGVVVAETYDDEVINKIYHPYNDRFLSVTMKSDGSLDKELVASVGESIYLNRDNPEGFNKLTDVFEKKSLQMVTFSITEKGYNLVNIDGDLTPAAVNDIEKGPDFAKTNMGIVTYLLYKRFQNGASPIAMVSTDNFSQNGQKLEDAVLLIARGWVKNNLVDQSFVDYLTDTSKVSFPWSMIDRITPNPSESVSERLKDEGFEDTEILHTTKHTNIAPFGNTEETHYLVIEDSFPNGRPALEKAGVLMANRETVNDADQMKVTACLNPLHTSLAIFGCLLDYKKISDEVNDDDLLGLIKNLGYGEDLPVVVDPKIINPKEFIDQLINKRLPNKNIPDTPQRIATDTSQKIPIRYGVTIKHYVDAKDKDVNDLEFIPLVLAGWCRYLMGIDDNGNKFELSNDPLLNDLQPYVNDIKLGDKVDVYGILRPILSNQSIFANDLYAIGLSEKIESYFNKMIQGKGAIRKTIAETVLNKGKKF